MSTVHRVGQGSHSIHRGQWSVTQGHRDAPCHVIQGGRVAHRDAPCHVTQGGRVTRGCAPQKSSNVMLGNSPEGPQGSLQSGSLTSSP